jgi:hypothetical protein
VKDAAAEAPAPVILQAPPNAALASMVEVMADITKVGVPKTGTNAAQGYTFQPYQEIKNTFAPIFAKHNLTIVPEYTLISSNERQTARGTTLIHTVLLGRFRFVSARDASEVVVQVLGESMDSGDKSFTKAMSMAEKYCLIQTFLIPTEGEEEPDAITVEPSTLVKPPEDFEKWFAGMVKKAEEGVAPLKDAWAKSAEDLRTYAEKFRTEAWNNAKKRSAAVDKAKKQQQANP